MQSHPVWVRGLKLNAPVGQKEVLYVAPCMGAWIETRFFLHLTIHTYVAPCMGAWIETKLLPLCPFRHTVAPCMGAWIETITDILVNFIL